MKDICDIFSGEGLFLVPKSFASKFEPEVCMFLACLIEARKIFNDEWFFQTSESIEKRINLSDFRQRKVIKILIENGILEQKNIGIPCRRYFRLNIEVIQRLVFEPLKDKSLSHSKTNYKTYNNKINNNKIKNKQKGIDDKNNSTNDSKTVSSQKLTTSKSNISTIQKLPYSSDKFLETFENFVQHRKEIKKPMTAQATNGIINILKTVTEEDGIELMNTSIIGGYQSLYPKPHHLSEKKARDHQGKQVQNQEPSKFDKQVDLTDSLEGLFDA